MKKWILLCCTFSVLSGMLTALPAGAEGLITPREEITASSERETGLTESESKPESAPAAEAEASGLTMQIGEVSAEPGKTVEIPVKLTQNPDGLSYFKAVIQTDAAVSFSVPMIGGYLREQANDIVYDISGNTLTVIWGSGNGKETLSSAADTALVSKEGFPYTETNDAFFTVVVTVPEEARPDTVYTVAFAQDAFEAMDGQEKAVSGHAEAGKITVTEPTGNALDNEKETSAGTPNVLAWVLILAAGMLGGFGLAFASSEARRKKEAGKSGEVAKTLGKFRTRLNETESTAQALKTNAEFTGKGTIKNLEQECKSLKKKYKALEEQIGNLRTAAGNLEAIGSLPSGNETALQEQLTEINSENKTLKQTIQSQKDQISMLTAQNQTFLEQNGKLQNQLTLLQEQQTAAQETPVSEPVRTATPVRVRPVRAETPIETDPEPQEEKPVSENDALIQQLEEEKNQDSSEEIPVYTLLTLNRKIRELVQKESTFGLYVQPDGEIKAMKLSSAPESQEPEVLMEITPEGTYIFYPVCDEDTFDFSPAKAAYFEYDNAGMTEDTCIQPCVIRPDKTHVKGRIWTENR